MKHPFSTLIICLTTSLLTILVYDYFRKPAEKIVIREMVPQPQFANLPQPQFSSRHTTAPDHFVKAAAVATPCVVNIKATLKNKGTFDDFWNASGISNGSGVVIAADGYIVTNRHVVEGTLRIEVTLNDNRTYEAKVIGTDASTDLALIKIEETALPFMDFADSDLVPIGEWVMAVGNPFNLTSTVTAGIVSAKGRNINILEGAYKIESFIQTDAAVNPGNSGGALVNTEGKLIGINTAIITQSGRYEGYSFAVPSNLVRKVVADLKEFGMVQRGFLGVVIRDVDESLAQSLGLENITGVYVDEINKGSAAQEAGLLPKDVITHINYVPVATMPELQEQVARYRPGDRISVSFIRKKTPQTIILVLKNHTNTTELLSQPIKIALLDDLGIELRELTKAEQHRLDTKGVKVVSIRKGSKMDRANMDPDFIIVKINDIPVQDVSSVVLAVEEAKSKVMVEGIYEDYPGIFYYAIVK